MKHLTCAEYWLAMDWLSSALMCCAPAAPPFRTLAPGGGLPMGVLPPEGVDLPLEAASGLPRGLSPPLLPLLPLSMRPTAERTARTLEGDTLRLPDGLITLGRPLECLAAGPLPACPGGIGCAAAMPLAAGSPGTPLLTASGPSSDSGASSPTFCRTCRCAVLANGECA